MMPTPVEGIDVGSDDEVPFRPTPSDPDDLSELLAGAAGAGLVVTTDITGGFPPDVGEACVMAMHRIIQEALTNAARHAGSGAVDLVIHHRPDRVEVQIVNGPGTPPDPTSIPSTGVGIIGMTERAEGLG
ncbi:MAG: ATP-binding protein, partial [Actinomycetota bacterium]